MNNLNPETRLSRSRLSRITGISREVINRLLDQGEIPYEDYTRPGAKYQDRRICWEDFQKYTDKIRKRKFVEIVD